MFAATEEIGLERTNFARENTSIDCDIG